MLIQIQSASFLNYLHSYNMQLCTDKCKIMFSVLSICYIVLMYLSESIYVERIFHLLFYKLFVKYFHALYHNLFHGVRNY